MDDDDDFKHEKRKQGDDFSHRETYPDWVRPMKAMRAKCIDCSGGNPGEVRMCPIDDCPLWLYRFGKGPQTVKDQSLVTKGGKK